MARIVCNEIEFDRIDAIVFDKDGTLSNSHQFLKYLGKKRAECVEAIVPNLRPAILSAFGFKRSGLNPSGLLAVGTHEENEIAIASLVAQTGYDWIEARAIAHSSFQLAEQQLPRKATLTPPFTGVVELLRSLTSLKLGILSSDNSANVQDFVEYYELSNYFQSITGAQTGISKPNPKLLTLACQALKVEPEKTLVVGDTIADVRLSHLSIGVTWGGSTIEQLAGAAAIAHHPSEIQLRHA
jgi:phosphoglycolate phosphatase